MAKGADPFLIDMLKKGDMPSSRLAVLQNLCKSKTVVVRHHLHSLFRVINVPMRLSNRVVKALLGEERYIAIRKSGENVVIRMIDRRDVIDGTVVRVPKAYPAYFGEYREFEIVRAYLDRFNNLFPVGRNGMHRYNNQDHSMLAANGAVNSIINGGHGKSAIWTINSEDEYHEEIDEVA